MEYKLLPAEFKMSEDGNGSISGYASTFANWDSVKERPEKGAFAPHLPMFLKRGFVAVAHEWGPLGIGMPKKAYEDDHGLFVEAKLHSTQDAQVARTKMRERIEEGLEVSLSIGYEVVRDEYVPDGRLLKEIKLYEWSIVNVPANDQAGLTAIKSQRVPLTTQVQQVRAAVAALEERVKSLDEIRAKDGRRISAATLQELEQVDTAIEALMAARQSLKTLIQEARGRSDPDAAKALYLEFQRIQAQLNGAIRP